MRNITIIGLGSLGLATIYHLRNFNLTLVDNCVEQRNSFYERIEHFFRSRRFETHSAPILRSVHIASKLETDLVDAFFICLPTEKHPTHRTLDTTIIESYLERLPEDALVIIRSTVPIGYFNVIQAAYPKMRFGYIPEFFKEETAFDEIVESHYVITAGELGDLGIAGAFVSGIRRNNIHTTLAEAELIKLSTNAFIATKIGFMGEIHRYCIEHDLDSERIVNAICQNPYIGKTHNKAPYSITGKYLPKDLIELSGKMKSQFINLLVGLINK